MTEPPPDSAKDADSGRLSGGPTAPPRQSRVIFPWIAGAALLAFTIGILASPALEHGLRSQLPVELQDPPLATPAAVPMQPAIDPSPRLDALEAIATRQAEADAALMQQMDALAAQLAAVRASTVAAPASSRDLLLVMAAQDMVQDGRSMTRFMPVIATQFAARDQPAVDALAAWNSDPVTRAALQISHDPADRPAATSAAPDDFWARIRAGLGQMVRVEPARPADDAHDDAIAKLEQDDLQGAIVAMNAAAPSATRDRWLADARRLQSAEDALARLEALALVGLQLPSDPGPVNAVPVAPVPPLNTPLP